MKRSPCLVDRTWSSFTCRGAWAPAPCRVLPHHNTTEPLGIVAGITSFSVIPSGRLEPLSYASCFWCGQRWDPGKNRVAPLCSVNSDAAHITETENSGRPVEGNQGQVEAPHMELSRCSTWGGAGFSSKDGGASTEIMEHVPRLIRLHQGRKISSTVASTSGWTANSCATVDSPKGLAALRKVWWPAKDPTAPWKTPRAVCNSFNNISIFSGATIFSSTTTPFCRSAFPSSLESVEAGNRLSAVQRHLCNRRKT